MKKWVLFIFCLANVTQAQQSLELFLQPSDSLNLDRKKIVFISEAALGVGSLLALHQAWYKDYPRSSFHFKNDNAHWNQMDKAGHFFTSFHLSRFGAEAISWAGASKKEQLLYGASFGFLYLTTIEILDGFSSQWGASWGDVAANFSGSALYVGQELLWQEQRIIPKFSFHHTPYAAARPSLLGENRLQQILKDYNGQTYWLSFNVASFLPNTNDKKFPKWLNIAVGYGSEGMVIAEDKLVNTLFFDDPNRSRQFYLSLDVDLTKISTNSSTLKTLFSIFNTVKIPAPTFELTNYGHSKWHWIYF